MEQCDLRVVCDALKLRQEGPGDGTFLLRLFVETHGDMLGGLEPPLRDLLLSQQFAGQAASYRAAYADGRFEIITHASAPIGRVVTHGGPGGVRIVDVAVLDAWRGRGTGGWALRQVLDRADAAGSLARLSVRPDNRLAQRFYQRLGFATVERSELAIEMERPVGHPGVTGSR